MPTGPYWDPEPPLFRPIITIFLIDNALNSSPLQPAFSLSLLAAISHIQAHKRLANYIAHSLPDKKAGPLLSQLDTHK